MQHKKILKIIVDILMFSDFVFLMCHEVVRNLSAHGIYGIALFVLFILHHLLNLGFYRSTFRGRYNGSRIMFSATSWILFLLMILMAFSSVMMSGAVFSFSSINMTRWSRTLHTFSCAWGFLVVGFHLGLHLYGKIKKAICKMNSSLRIAPVIFMALIFFLGIFFIVKSKFYVYLFCLNAWKLSAPNIFSAIAQYLSMTFAMIVLAIFARRLCENKKVME